MSEQKNWRAMLENIGGWDNELVSVPAGAVRELIEEVEALRVKIKQYEVAEKQEPEWYLVEDDSQDAFEDEIQFLSRHERVDAEYWAKQDGVTLTPLYTRPAPMPEGCVLERYDAGYLNDYGGGNVGWWQDYLRSELERAHEFYQSQIDAMLTAAEEGK